MELPTDIIHHLLTFVEPDKKLLTNNCEYCSKTFEFKTQSDKIIDCKDYCLKNISSWIFNLFNIEYILSEYNINFKIEKIRINGFDNNNIKIFLKIYKDSNKDIIFDFLENMNINIIMVESTGFCLPVCKYVGDEANVKEDNRVDKRWTFGIYTREDKYFVSKVVYNTN